jgi:hypothetical protein
MDISELLRRVRRLIGERVLLRLGRAERAA